MTLLLRYLESLEIDTSLEVLGLPKTTQSALPYNRYLAAFEAGHLAGVVKLYESPEMSNIHIEMLEVAEADRHHGVASALLEHVFVEAAERAKTVTNNGFTDIGKQHLIHVRNRLAQKYGVSQEVIGRC